MEQPLIQKVLPTIGSLYFVSFNGFIGIVRVVGHSVMPHINFCEIVNGFQIKNWGGRKFEGRIAILTDWIVFECKEYVVDEETKQECQKLRYEPI